MYIWTLTTCKPADMWYIDQLKTLGRISIERHSFQIEGLAKIRRSWDLYNNNAFHLGHLLLTEITNHMECGMQLLIQS